MDGANDRRKSETTKIPQNELKNGGRVGYGVSGTNRVREGQT